MPRRSGSSRKSEPEYDTRYAVSLGAECVKRLISNRLLVLYLVRNVSREEEEAGESPEDDDPRP